MISKPSRSISCEKYDAIVFDFDGTLVDSNEIKSRAFGKLYKSYGEEIVRKVVDYHSQHEGISRFIKFKYWQEILLGQPYTDELGEQLSLSYSGLVVDAVVQASFFDGAYEFLENHYQSSHLFVASGTPEPELREIVKRRKMDRFFQGVYGSPSTKKQILEHILKQNNLSPERLLMVGDALSDWEGAKQTKVCFVGIMRGRNLAGLASEQIIKNIHELYKLI